MSTGERIKKLRKDKGLTQKKLADSLALSLDMIKSLEQNRTSLSVENLKRFAEFFECSTDYLLGRDEQDHNFRDDLLAYLDKFEIYQNPIRTEIESLPSRVQDLTDEQFELMLSVFKSLNRVLDKFEQSEKEITNSNEDKS